MWKTAVPDVLPCMVGGWTNPVEKYARSSNWIISPRFGVKIPKNYLKPPPSMETAFGFQIVPLSSSPIPGRWIVFWVFLLIVSRNTYLLQFQAFLGETQTDWLGYSSHGKSTRFTSNELKWLAISSMMNHIITNHHFHPLKTAWLWIYIVTSNIWHLP